jgi:hypothetical protein
MIQQWRELRANQIASFTAVLRLADMPNVGRQVRLRRDEGGREWPQVGPVEQRPTKRLVAVVIC